MRETADRDIIVVGASAGGVESLKAVMRRLPEDLPAAILVVLHMPPGAKTFLPRILQRAGPLPAVQATDGQAIERGRIYVATPDAHMLVMREGIRLVFGPRVNGARPAVDPLFRSAARAYGSRVTGAILSGSLDDGTAGLAAIKERGGTTVVLDPHDALYPGMARSAIDSMAVDHVAPLEEIGPLLDRLSRGPAPERADEPVEGSIDSTELDPLLQGHRTRGVTTDFSCPECSGTLYETETGGVTSFQCHVGHAFSPESLVDAQSSALEAALWTALRTLEESALMAHRMVHRMSDRGSEQAVARFRRKEKEMLARAAVVRGALLDRDPGPRPAELVEGEPEGLRELS